jgi:aryl-phospho-beta-D-glucosidase BglC (GH1 family)
MKFIQMSLFILLAVPCAMPTLNAQQKERTPNRFDWLNNQDDLRPVNNPNARKLPLISVKGNKFINAVGDTILFRGVAIADPDKIEQEGRWNKNLFVKVKELGAMIVRIPVHPVPWRMRTPAKYLQLLRQAVDWCTELGMYVVIDWHSIGNLGMELFQNREYVTSRQETYEFWRTIAMNFRGNTTVAFYELFNEPTLFNGQLGSMSWSEWKKINENIIHLIRAYDNEKIPLVAGLDWAYDLTPLRIEPIEAEGIGYVTHPYSHKRPKPYEPKWEEDFGFAAGRYPVVATEFGFVMGREGMVENGEYGKTIINYLERKGISWICWVYDPEWRPAMLKSWDTFQLTESGEFFKEAMQRKVVK